MAHAANDEEGVGIGAAPAAPHRRVGQIQGRPDAVRFISRKDVLILSLWIFVVP